MVIGHNKETAKYILTGNSIEDLEKGLAEMKRQIANGITFSVCYGGEDTRSEFDKNYCNTFSNDCDWEVNNPSDDGDCDCDIYTCCDDCDKCDYDDEDWDICEDCDEDCRDGLCPREVAEEEANDEENTAVDEAVNEFIKIIKDILGM